MNWSPLLMVASRPWWYCLTNILHLPIYIIGKVMRVRSGTFCDPFIQKIFQIWLSFMIIDIIWADALHSFAASSKLIFWMKRWHKVKLLTPWLYQTAMILRIMYVFLLLTTSLIFPDCLPESLCDKNYNLLLILLPITAQICSCEIRAELWLVEILIKGRNFSKLKTSLFPKKKFLA